MEAQYLIYASPIFTAAIAAEWLWLRRKRRQDGYALGTVISDMGCGMVFQVLVLFLHAASIVGYVAVYERWRVFEMPSDSAWTWLVAFFAVDLAYYAWHRASHVINFLWAVHSVHHQSEDFNLSVGLRQPAFEPFTLPVFFLPLALVGIAPHVTLLCFAINFFYQFWIHTEVVRSLGPLEWVLNTPSHHRVHHGTNPDYLDKNYGGVFVIWDRLLGSYTPERESVVYGTTKPIRSYDIAWANVQHWVHMARLARRARRWQDKFRVWVAHPSFIPEGTTAEPGDGPRVKYRPPLPRRLSTYVAIHFVLASLALSWLALHEPSFATPWLLAPGAVLIVSLLVLPAWIEHRPGVVAVDVVRQLGVVAVVAAAGHAAGVNPVLVATIVGLCAASLVTLFVWCRPWTATRAAPHVGSSVSLPRQHPLQDT